MKRRDFFKRVGMAVGGAVAGVGVAKEAMAKPATNNTIERWDDERVATIQKNLTIGPSTSQMYLRVSDDETRLERVTATEILNPKPRYSTYREVNPPVANFDIKWIK